MPRSPRTDPRRTTAAVSERVATLCADVRSCDACDLHLDRQHVAIGDGPIPARVLVVSVAPTRHEDLHGRALTGGARNLLDHAAATAGLDAAALRITNLVRCRPPGDRQVTRDEVRSCIGHLRREIALVEPEVVVALGGFVTRVLTGRAVSITQVAGYRLPFGRGITLVPTYHPSDALRGVPRAAEALQRGFATAKAVLDGELATGSEVVDTWRAQTSLRQ